MYKMVVRRCGFWYFLLENGLTVNYEEKPCQRALKAVEAHIGEKSFFHEIDSGFSNAYRIGSG